MDLQDPMGLSNRKLIPGYYAIVDYVANNPMNAYNRYPVLIAMNVPPEIVEQIKSGQINLPEGSGTIQRAYCKIEEVKNFQNMEE